MKKAGFLAIVLAIFVPFSVFAETVLRTGQDIRVTADQVVGGDYYVWVGFGDTSMSGSVEGDMYGLGGSVNVNGSIKNDLSIISGTAQLSAPVGDDVRIVSFETTIDDHIQGDLFVIAGKLTVLSSARIDGDIFFFGGQGTIAGTVGGSIMGSSEKLRIDAQVGKNVDVRTFEELTLGDSAEIMGTLTYASPQSLVRAPQAVVEGEITEQTYTHKEPKIEHFLLPGFMSLFASLTFFLLFRRELQALVQRIHTRPARSSFFGLAAFILGPIVSILLMITLLGMFVGIAFLALSVLLYVLGFVLSGAVVGAYLAQLFIKKLQVSLLWIIIGTVVVHGALYIPVVGPLFVFAVVLLTMGGIAYGLYKEVS